MSGEKTSQKRLFFSWNHFDHYVQRLSTAVKENVSQDPQSAPTNILSLGRGGSPCAVILSHIFNCPMYYYGISSYSSTNVQGRLNHFQELNFAVHSKLQAAGKQLLVVDDIWDTGETFKWAKGQFPAAQFASLAVKGDEDYDDYLDFWAVKVAPDTWVEFPWE